MNLASKKGSLFMRKLFSVDVLMMLNSLEINQAYFIFASITQ